MGCCGRNKKKVKSTNDSKRKEKKEIIPIDEIDQSKIAENQLLKTDATSIDENPIQVKSSLEHQTKSPSDDTDDFISNISSTDNISPVKTLNNLQKLVQKHDKSVSMVLFYGRYCPYSERAMPNLRQWIRANKDRIFLYEVDVEQAADLVEYYHIRSIPTIMAFEEKNLIAPIWQRSANNVLSSSTDDSEPTMEDQSDNLDPSFQKSDRLNEIKDENTIDQSDSVDHIDSKSFASSVQSPYLWNPSTHSISQQSSSITEYNGRMISQSTISQSTKKRPWNEYFDDYQIQSNDYPQHIHLPNCNEIFYQKEFDLNSSDRLSTLTYQHVQERNHSGNEEICVLYLGPHRNRGFEDILPSKMSRSSKLSLLTLQSNENHYLFK